MIQYELSNSDIEPSPEQIIKEALEKFQNKKFVGLYSGGKDSLAICHYLSERGILNEVLYCDTGIKVMQNFEYVIKTCEKYNWKLNIVHPKETETYEKFIQKFGFPKSGIHSAIMGFLKWHPIRKFAKEHKDQQICFVSGRRKRESK